MQSRKTVAAGPDWGHVVLVLFFAAMTGLYLLDAWQASSRLRNLILILPASILSLILCTVILVGIFMRGGEGGEEEEISPPREGPPLHLIVRYKPAFTIAVFALYILSIPYLGFDVGTAAFMFVMLLLEGERKPLTVLGVPILFAAVVTICFRYLLPYPMPILLL